MLPFTLLLAALELVPICTAHHPIPSHIDLEYRTGSNIRNKYDIQTLSESDRFWFGSFDVGNAKNLTLLVDTGSSDVVLNPGVYKKSAQGVNTHKNFSITYGSTESDGSGTLTVPNFPVNGSLYNDTIRFGTLKAHQTIGSINPTGDGTNVIPEDGIVGFAGMEMSSFNGPSPFFHSLCEQHQVAACRFGVTLGDNEKGTQVLGALDRSLFKGELTTTSIYREWALYVDFAINGQIVMKDALVDLDTGTATIIGPVKDVIAVLEAASVQYVVQSSSAGTTVTGYFPCDKPPTLGLSIPSQSNVTTAAKQNSKLVSRESSIFNLEPSQWIAADNGNNNCTAIVSGTDVLPQPNMWVVGQPFFHGIYVDHNLQDRTLGFAPAPN
ncbi:acid protease [Penicillium hispanicum]|uniref:acid protease n=1 Tax=Penicillium hispanicum TaxID=1080232 RepID=UPI0025403AC9|nr:acid protease [Penicillium hispanicum]KAJ5587197.1 acid protease [Penicillium hispanicum]